MSRTASISGVLIALLMSRVPAFANQENLLVGAWTVDVSKLTMPNPPNSVTLVLAVIGGGKYQMTVEIHEHSGERRHGACTFTPDGTSSHDCTGTADYDVVSMTMPSRRVLIMGGGFQGHPANTRVFSLSEDGRHMIETVVSHAPDGTPRTRVDIWNRANRTVRR